MAVALSSVPMWAWPVIAIVAVAVAAVVVRFFSGRNSSTNHVA